MNEEQTPASNDESDSPGLAEACLTLGTAAVFAGVCFGAAVSFGGWRERRRRKYYAKAFAQQSEK